MKIIIYCIGKLKESYWADAVAEYSKRIQGYCKLEIVELPDCPTPEKASPTVEREIKEKEGKKVLEKLKPSDFVVALDLNRKEYDSPSFSQEMESWFRQGGSSVSFLIGGSLGLSDSLKNRANAFFSFGKMTFPHQLARVMLLEQLYRGFRIAHNEPYHK